MKSTFVPGASARIRSTVSRPSIPRIIRSLTTRSTVALPLRKWPIASSPSAAPTMS
jgi:hypothetical protein